MSRSYWRAIIAFVGLAILALGSGVTYQLYDASEQRHASYDYQPAGKPSLPKGMQGEPIAKGYQPNCDNPYGNVNSDLCAQWAAVDQVTEANRMSSLNLRFAIASLWATIIATALLLWTLVETRETARRELRAYLFSDATILIIGVKPHNRGRLISVVAVKNSGTTPAQRVCHWSNLCIDDIGNDGDKMAPKTLDPVNQTTISPNGTITADRWIEKPHKDDVTAVRNGTKAVFIYGAIEYEDVFERQHRTDYRTYFSGMWPPPENAVIRFCPSGNSAT